MSTVQALGGALGRRAERNGVWFNPQPWVLLAGTVSYLVLMLRQLPCQLGGSVYKMIPSIFEVRSRQLDVSDAERRLWVRVRSGTLIGFAGAFGALGGVGINLVLRQSYERAGTETPAFWIFLGCYVAAAVLAWARYVRAHDTVAPVAVQTGAEVPVNT